MAPTRGQMLEVELLDAAPTEASPDAPASGHPRGPRARRRGRRAVVAAALLGVLAAYLTGVVGARRDESRAEALASVPGVVAPMTSPVRELWHSRGWLGSDLRQVDGRLVGAVSVPYLTVDVVALDPRTGTDVWRTPVGPAAVNKLWTRCVVPGAPYVDVPPDVRPVVVCVAVDQTTTTEQSALGTMTYPTAVRLVVVDALTGATISDVPAPATSTVAPLGTDVVLAGVEPDGRARVARTDPRTGREAWQFTSPDRVPTDAFGQRSAQVSVADGRVVLEAGRTWVLSADGTVLRADDREPGADLVGPVEVLAGGRLLARPTQRQVGAGWGTEVVDLGTGRSFTAAGYPVRPELDDGSLDGVVLLQDNDGARIRGYDVASGRELWAGAPGGPPLVLDGRIVDVDDGVLRAVDGRTGQVAWATSLGRVTRTTVVTDGRVVVVSLPGRTGGGVLAAYGLDDGRPRWTMDTPHELHLFGVDQQLFGWSERGLVALGR